MQVSSRCDRLSPKILPDHQPSNLRILLVEDNPTNQKLTLKQLQSLGHTADIVGNGYAAVTTIAHSRYDLVLMDCHLPLIDGFTATLAIRDRESQNTAPCSKRIIVIAMTASDSRQDRERAIAVGMDDYLLKPVRRETLATLLNHWSQIIAAADLPASDAPPRVSPELASARDFNSLSLHLDFEYLHQISDDCPDFEIELLQIFLEDSFLHLEELRQAIATHNVREAEQIAHHIKGASANVGAQIVRSAVEQLEEQARQGKFGAIDDLLTKIEFSLSQIQQFTHNF